MKDLILIGAGGHAESCIDVISLSGGYNIVGILDHLPDKIGDSVLGYPIIGTDDDLTEYRNKNVEFLITIGQIKSSKRRTELFQILKSLDCKLATVVSPLAHVACGTSIGEGTIVMHFALVNAGAKIGRNCIINSKSLIEHGVAIGDNCHISTAAVVNGMAKIGDGTFIGSNATIVQGVQISANEFVIAGSLRK